MNLEYGLILGILIHFVGDYILQNDYMSKHKTSNSLIALLHAFIYSLSFIIIVGLSYP